MGLFLVPSLFYLTQKDNVAEEVPRAIFLLEFTTPRADFNSFNSPCVQYDESDKNGGPNERRKLRIRVQATNNSPRMYGLTYGGMAVFRFI